MKILQINCVYKKGSTGKIMYDLHTELKKNGFESIICYGRGEKIKEDDVYKTSSEVLAKFNNLKSRVTGLQYNGSFLATQKLLSIIKKENPQIVHLHCINGFFVNIYTLLNYLKRKKIKTVLTLHGEFMYTANCGISLDCDKWKKGCKNCPNFKKANNTWFFNRTEYSWRKMYKSFLGFEELRIISVSPWLGEQAKISPFFNNKRHQVILNGIDTENLFYPRSNQEISKIKDKYQLNEEKIILHVTSNFHSELKGGKYIIELAKRFNNCNVKFVIIGDNYIKTTPSNNVISVGKTNNQEELAIWYSLADLTVITSKKETFSMVCAESLACGTPVVGFKAGGPEQISLKEFSDFVDYGDIKSLENKILKWLTNQENLSCKISQEAKSLYSAKRMYNQYLSFYEELSHNDIL